MKTMNRRCKPPQLQSDTTMPFTATKKKRQSPAVTTTSTPRRIHSELTLSTCRTHTSNTFPCTASQNRFDSSGCVHSEENNEEEVIDPEDRMPMKVAKVLNSNVLDKRQ